jgi:glycosyltransferase involved in cell wall biosynthesis
MMANRVLLINTTPGIGHGAESALARLIAGWPDPGPVQLSVSSPTGSRIEAICKQQHMTWYRWSARRDRIDDNLRACRTLGKQLSPADSFDTVFAWGARAFEWTVWLARMRSAQPAGRLADHPAMLIHGQLRQRLLRWSANHMAYLVAPSEALATAIRGSGWKPPVHRLYNGIPSVPVVPGPDAATIQIGFLGCYARWKGCETLPAFLEATSDLPVHWHLYGQLQPETKQVIEGLCNAFPRRTTYHGERTPEEIFPALHLVLHPSQAFDPSPNVLKEAAAHGLPVVTTDAGGSAEITEQAKTGFVYPMASAAEGIQSLRRLITQPDLREEMGRAARARMTTLFSPEQMVEHFIQLLSDTRLSPPVDREPGPA